MPLYIDQFVQSPKKINVYFVFGILLIELCNLGLYIFYCKSVVLKSYFILLVPNPSHAIVTKWSMDVLFSVYSPCSALSHNLLQYLNPPSQYKGQCIYKQTDNSSKYLYRVHISSRRRPN